MAIHPSIFSHHRRHIKERSSFSRQKHDIKSITPMSPSTLQSTQTKSNMPTIYSDRIQLRFWRYLYLTILIAFPSFYASRASDLPVVIDPQLATLTIQTSRTLASTPLENMWVVYLDARVAEWKVIFTVACVLVG